LAIDCAGARAAILFKAANLLRERTEAIATAATLEQGKPLAESRAEASYVASLVEFYAGEAVRIYGRVLTRPPGARSLVLKEPVGPSVAFCPLNFPILGPASKDRAGPCRGMFDHPQTGGRDSGFRYRCGAVLPRRRLAASVLSLVFGVADRVSARLLSSPIIRKLSFTGSVAVGKHLLRLASGTMKRRRWSWEDTPPVLVFEDCDVEGTAASLAAAKFS